MTLSLTGFMGCGKSSVGKELSALLGCNLTDLDSYIEATQGQSIPDIFRTQGENAFRQMERIALKELLCDNGTNGEKGQDITILSLGGGTLTTPECASLIRQHTECIYLRASTDTLARNLENDFNNRPMLSQSSDSPYDKYTLRAKIEKLMRIRSTIYESAAHRIIDIDGKSFREIAEEIAGCLKED